MWNDALPRNGITNWSVFYAQQNASSAIGWFSWMKPAGCSWIYIFMIGAGGGGGRPANGALTTAAGGGGSGSVMRSLIPATLLPDIIYIRPGFGGLGSTNANGNGATGVASYISIAPNTTAQNVILFTTAGVFGSAVTTGGAGGNASTGGNFVFGNVGLFTAIAGQTGGAGAAAANTNGSDVTFGASGIPITSGAGGGNGTGSGGGIVGAGFMPSISGGTSNNAGGNGFRQGQTIAPGFKLFPLLFSGGAGGGGSNLQTAGAGGRGAWGCGGGGGGGASGAGTSGNGGNGGDALILIGAF